MWSTSTSPLLKKPKITLDSPFGINCGGPLPITSSSVAGFITLRRIGHFQFSVTRPNRVRLRYGSHVRLTRLRQPDHSGPRSFGYLFEWAINRMNSFQFIRLVRLLLALLRHKGTKKDHRNSCLFVNLCVPGPGRGRMARAGLVPLAGQASWPRYSSDFFGSVF